MKEETWKVTLVLIAVMSASILAINLIPQQGPLVPVTTLRAMENAELVDRVRAWPEELEITLREPVSIRSEEGRIRTDAVRLERSDSTRALEKGWEERGLLEFYPVGQKERVAGEWIFIGILLVGCAFAVIKAQRDRKNGSVRKQIEDVKDAYERGVIDEDEYSRRINDLMPYL